MKITKRQLRRIIKEARRAPDKKWWYAAFNMVIEDQIGYGEPTPEQSEAILGGLQLVIEDLEMADEPQWDHADQDYADQAYIEKYGDPYED
jgi:hypothetical protein